MNNHTYMMPNHYNPVEYSINQSDSRLFGFGFRPWGFGFGRPFFGPFGFGGPFFGPFGFGFGFPFFGGFPFFI